MEHDLSENVVHWNKRGCGCLPHQDTARWQHDKVVSISAATVEDKRLKIIVACQGIQNGILPMNTKPHVMSKKTDTFLTVLFLVAGKERIHQCFGKNLIQQHSSKNILDLT